MSEAELPQDPTQLQVLARQQAKELKELQEQLNASHTEKISVSNRVYFGDSFCYAFQKCYTI
jgi:hypothetical protein